MRTPLFRLLERHVYTERQKRITSPIRRSSFSMRSPSQHRRRKAPACSASASGPRRTAAAKARTTVIPSPSRISCLQHRNCSTQSYAGLEDKAPASFAMARRRARITAGGPRVGKTHRIAGRESVRATHVGTNGMTRTTYNGCPCGVILSVIDFECN